jgi:hypothetical protein
MTDLDQFRAELAGSLAGLSPSQRLKAGREMADRLGVVLAAIVPTAQGGAVARLDRAVLDGQDAAEVRPRPDDLNGHLARCWRDPEDVSASAPRRWRREGRRRSAPPRRCPPRSAS